MPLTYSRKFYKMNFTTILFVICTFVKRAQNEVQLVANKYEPLVLLKTTILLESTNLFSSTKTEKTTENGFVFSSVPVTVEKLYLCPPEEQNDINFLQKLDEKKPGTRHCLFEKPLYIPEKNCKHEVIPIFMKETIPLYQCKCNIRPLYEMHHFAFTNCHSLNSLYIERIRTKLSANDMESALYPEFKTTTERIYQICLKNSEVYWTKHEISTDLPTSPTFYDDIKPSTDINGLPSSYFNDYKEAFEKTQGFVKYPMVPPEDIPLYHATKATQHIMNYAPLSTELVPLMSVINAGIRKAAIKLLEQFPKRNENLYLNESYFHQQHKLKIYTTTTTWGKNELKYLNNDKRFPIPDIWCKLVYYEEKNQAILIIVHNTHQGNFVKFCSTSSFRGIACDFEKWSDINIPNYDNLKKFAYCCEVTEDLLRRFFYHPFGVTKLFNIQKIIKNDRKTLKKLKWSKSELDTYIFMKLDAQLVEAI